MSISLSKKLVEFVLLGSSHDRRQLQDSPILGDVWLAYGEAPTSRLELLIEPHWKHAAGTVAIEVHGRLDDDADSDVAALHGIVAARLSFDELLSVVVPMSSWWHSERIQRELGELQDSGRSAQRRERLERILRTLVGQARATEFREGGVALDDDQLPALDRFITLAGLIRWAQSAEAEEPKTAQTATFTTRKLISSVLGALTDTRANQHTEPAIDGVVRPIVWQVSLNRTALPALVASVPSVKADAARRLFGVDCTPITWAVIDSGIHGSHPAFLDAKGSSRVRRAFDFTRIRRIVSLDNLRPKSRSARIDELLALPLLEQPTQATVEGLLEELARDARARRAIHWDLVLPLVEINPHTRPASSDHGTHVAGIIGGSPNAQATDVPTGLCPEITLFDFRVLSPNVRDTEFAIIAALQFIRFLNDQTDYMAVHGANLSLSIPHDVRNYACGRTPICLESERLVDSGVVVVAAAGNLGYQSFQTRDGSYDGYAAFSVTDPGNAESVITVGSTHRSAPHTYGVSFFSSRGPTGDGRAKPDLVAPGERIRGPLREGLGELDGTSMAAPHVSGAAAMLMARYAELIGQPRRIKRILCESATDLGRERSFQGHGMLDVLRAFQSI